MKLIGIGACDPNGVIGKNGKLPWHYPEDLRHFSQTIADFPLVMGYNTYLGLPSHYFEGRTSIIFSRRLHDSSPTQKFVSSLKEFFSLAGETKLLYVIGGAEVFRLFLETNLIDEFILTKLTNVYDGDTFFPLSFLDDWKETILRKTPELTLYQYGNPCK